MPSSEEADRTDEMSRSDRNPGLELFFDLVFVLCVAQLADVFHEEASGETALRVLLLFVPVWWTWTGVTFAVNRFPKNNNTTNLALLVAAAASGMMALAIPEIPGSGNAWFAVGYATVRIIIALLYLRGRTQDERLTAFYAASFTVTAIVWLASIGVPHSVQPFLWAAAMAIDIATPALADRTQRILPVDREHLPDRFGAFAIIVLGEAAVNTVGAAHGPLSEPILAVIAEGFVLAALLWWGFFDRRAWQLRYELLADHESSGRIAYVVCAYLHFPLVVGITAVGAGAQIALDDTAEAIPLGAALTVGVGIGCYLVALNAMTWVLRTPTKSSLAWWRTGLVVVLAGWVALGRSYPAPVFLAGCIVVLVVHTLVNVSRERACGRGRALIKMDDH